MGLKPIFEEERLFFKEKTKVDLPTDCWRNGSKIFLDIYSKIPLLTFKIENKEIKIKTNNFEKLKEYTQVKLNEILERERERVSFLFEKSVNDCTEYLKDKNNYKIVLSHSSGKDSTILYEVFKESNKIIDLNYEILFCNTSNDTSDTYKYIKQELPQDILKIVNPKEGFYQWIKRENYFIPNKLARNCCSVYKEGQINKIYNKNESIIMLIGVRKYESSKRAKYEMIMDYDFNEKLFGKGKSNISKNWINFSPIIDWKDEDVWIYLLLNNIKLNKQYYYGFNRCGCLICPYQSDYIDLLIEKYYPNLWKRWITDILPKSYKNSSIEKRFKWTLEEYINGKWKTGTSKVYELTQGKATKQKVEKLMEILNLDNYEIAIKYFKNNCSICSKKLNPTEVAMNLKLFGRNINKKKLLCRTHLCEDLNIDKKQYKNMSQTFNKNGCNLF